MRYVESNPLHPGMVADLAAYPRSTYIVHGLGKSTSLVTEAPVWASLGKTETARQAYWRKWLHTPFSAKELQSIRRAVTTGRPYGAPAWVEATALRLGVNFSP